MGNARIATMLMMSKVLCSPPSQQTMAPKIREPLDIAEAPKACRIRFPLGFVLQRKPSRLIRLT